MQFVNPRIVRAFAIQLSLVEAGMVVREEDPYYHYTNFIRFNSSYDSDSISLIHILAVMRRVIYHILSQFSAIYE